MNKQLIAFNILINQNFHSKSNILRRASSQNAPMSDGIQHVGRNGNVDL